MSLLTPTPYSGGNLGAAGYGTAAYSQDGGVLNVNPSAYNGCGGSGPSLASSSVTNGGGRKTRGKKGKGKGKGKTKGKGKGKGKGKRCTSKLRKSKKKQGAKK
jgi:hypothetical protein